MYLSKHPFCDDPFKTHEGRAVLATDVHHKAKKAEGGSDKEENLMPLCHSCHSRITAKGG
jgi:5-methylcytosine-specific restriction protein A